MNYKESLEKLGYDLLDFGNHWRTKAIYRGGKTPNSVLVYKDNGVWRDFGSQDTKPKPFIALVKETLKTEDKSIISQFVDDANTKYTAPKKEEKIEMEKIYPESMLKKLLPIRNFYLERNISEEIQGLFECGYSGSGKMYRRIVFPIYNLENRIHGFSGRSVRDSDGKTPKWIHIGRKNNFIYPFHLSKDEIEAKKEVIIVESIGDCLALYERGYKNVLVNFGLDIPDKMLTYLNSFELERIIVSCNNDKDKKINSGAISSIKNICKLFQLFDLSTLRINPPVHYNDFGDMNMDENPDEIFDKWYERKDKWNLGDENFLVYVSQKIKEHSLQTKHCKKFLSHVNKTISK